MSEVERVAVGGLKVAKILHDFVVDEVIPGTGIEASAFWQGLDRIVHDFAPRNRALLQKRDALQTKIDDWYRGRRGQPFDQAAQKAFLAEIGYLVPEGPPFKVDTANVDEEIAADRRTAARRAGQQRALRAQCRQRAMGLALRRALWLRRHSARRRRRAAQGLRSGTRQARDRLGAAFPR